MSQPDPYVVSTDFTDLPDEQVKTKLDIEFPNVATSILEIITNLGLIQRDDGALVNAIVTPDSLNQAVLNLIALNGFVVRGAWLTATNYAKGDVVGVTGGTYVCNTPHVSGTFSVDLAAGKWILLSSTAASTAGSYSVTGAVAPAEGIYKPAASTLGLAAGGLDVLRLIGVGSAVNYFTMTNSAASGALSIAASGTDGNIDLNVTPKGTGKLNTTSLGVSSTAIPAIGIYSPAANTAGVTARSALALAVTNPASPVNWLQISGAATLFYPVIEVKGTDVDIGLVLLSKGAAGHVFNTNGGGTAVTQMVVEHVASSVNWLSAKGAATGSPILLTASSNTDTNVGMSLRTKGTGTFGFYTAAGGALQFDIVDTASAVNNLRATGGVGGGSPVLSCVGSDTNISLILTPKGTGAVRINGGLFCASALSANYPATGISAYLASNVIALFSGTQPIFVGLNTSSTDTNFTVATSSSGFINAGCDGTASNIILNLNSKGNASLLLKAGSVTALVCANTASGVNYLQITPAVAGSPAELAAAGSDTDIDLKLSPKGAGMLKLGTAGSMIANASIATVLGSVGPTGSHTAVQEWMQVKNSAGTVRYIPCF